MLDLYLLIDCNNFFVSCETLFNPDLRGRPVLVLSNNDGCVIARSNESKRLGIKMGQPFFEVRELVKRYNIAIYSSNLTLYGDISKRVMSVIRDEAPSIEVYSIDEAFVYLKGVTPEQAQEFGENIRRKILKWVGIPVSVGISPTKTLAKVAAKLCKEYPKLNGCCLMYRDKDIEKVLAKYPVTDVWGIGRRYGKMLKEVGAIKAGQFVSLPEQFINKKMGVTGIRTWRELQGVPCIKFDDTDVNKQQISTSRTFSKRLTDYEEIHSALISFTSICSEKLRAQKCVTQEVRVYLVIKSNESGRYGYIESGVTQLDEATDSLIELGKQVTQLVGTLYRVGVEYKKAGVILSKISPSNSIQLNLFSDSNSERDSKLMEVIDKINKTQGSNSLVLASQGVDPIRMNRNHLSPHYTTRWGDLLVVCAK